MQKMPVGSQIPSSTGGMITITRTGLIHSAGRTYSGQMAQIEAREAYQDRKSVAKKPRR